MNHAKVKTSNRLQRLLRVLADGREHSTLDLSIQAKICAVSAAISELRANGYDIECWCLGRGKFVYKLVENE